MTRIQKPIRRKHEYTQTLVAAPDEVFPLLCPVREMEWEEGWEPSLVISASGVAEPDCIFVVPDGKREATWVITVHDQVRFRIQFVKVTPGYLVAKIDIALYAADGNTTRAVVSYEYTALGDDGAAFVESFTESYYEVFMRTWEEALNKYLREG